MEKLAKTAIFILICLVSVSSAHPSDGNKQDVLKKCSEYFGKAIDEDAALFEVNYFYVLEVMFNKENKLKRFSVKPKEYFSDTRPEWEDLEGFDYLSWQEYQNVLIKLDLIKPKGKLVKGPAPISFVTNRTSWPTREFEFASMKTGITSSIIDDDDDAPSRIRSFYIDFEKEIDSQNIQLKMDK